MTLKQMYARHQELWFWLADNPGKGKADWPEWDRLGEYAESCCFPCEWAVNHRGGYPGCKKCPLDWPDGKCLPVGNTGIYREWRRAENGSDHRTVMADLIANVPLKKGLK